jgi:5-methyltetrahydropteroyltriglutamate--homocysteine methyltransferase
LAQAERAKNLNQVLKVVVPGLLAFLYLSRIINGNTAEAEKHA